ALASLVALAASACAAKVTTDDRPCPCAEGSVCCPQNVCVPMGTSCEGKTAPQPPSGPTTPTDVYASICADPNHGPLDAYADDAALRSRLIGRWYSCDFGNGVDIFRR